MSSESKSPVALTADMLKDEHVRCEWVSYYRRRLKLPLFMQLSDTSVKAVLEVVGDLSGIQMARVTASGKAIIVKVNWKQVKIGRQQFEEKLKTTAKQALISSISSTDSITETETEAVPQQSRSTRTKRSKKRFPNKRQQPRRNGHPGTVATT